MSFSDNIAKYFFIGSLATVALGGSFALGIVAHWKELPPVPLLKAINEDINSTGAAPSIDPRRFHVQPTRGQGDGVVTNQTNDDNVVLLVGFFDEENQARLVERDGTVLHRWSLDYFEHFPDSDDRACDLANPLRVDTHGAVVTEKGELVFNYEYCGTVKLDLCGSVQWALSQKTHHSLTRAEQGGYWALGRYKWTPADEPERFPPFSSVPGDTRFIHEDTIVLLSETGEVLEEVSIPVLMRESGLLPLLTATGDNFTDYDGGRRELVHANKLTELPENLADAFPLFSAGDLAISMRELNLVMVLDGETRAVKWHQIGPWLRQHDPEFRPDGRISIFNNNVFRNAYTGGQTNLDVPFTTNIILVDPTTNETEIRYGGPGQEMLSVIRGQHELLPNDGILITEFDAGRVIEIDASDEVVWEYVNRYDDALVGEIANASVFPRSYFEGGVPTPGSCS
ncbi:MAG: arylsulfotransferase family protein [Pseudomonadota bacterium]